MAKQKKQKKSARLGCRQVTFKRNKKGRRITPRTVTLCPRSAKERKRRVGRKVAKEACRRGDKGDRNPSTKHLFDRCDAR